MNKCLGDFSNIGRSLPIRNHLNEEEDEERFAYKKWHNQNYEKKTVSLQP